MYVHVVHVYILYSSHIMILNRPRNLPKKVHIKKRFKLDIFGVVQPNGEMYCFTVCIKRRIKR